jgi:hypothetical protein
LELESVGKKSIMHNLEPGQTYHLYSGNSDNARDRLLFVEQGDYRQFLQLYANYLGRLVKTYAYCLLPNHFHFLIHIRSVPDVTQPSIVSDPSLLDDVVTDRLQAFLKRYAEITKLSGEQSDPISALAVDYKAVSHYRCLTNMIVYIHQNPEYHGLVDDFRDWHWSSYGGLVSKGATRLDRDQVYAWFRGWSGVVAAHAISADMDLIAPYVEDDLD